MPEDTLISLSGVYKKFGNKPVLRDLALDVRLGETIVIIGRSGEGKSVLLKIILNLIEPDKGSIYYKKDNVLNFTQKEHEKFLKNFGMLFQGSALFDSLTVAENVVFGLRRTSHYSEHELDKIVSDKLALVGLKNIQEAYPSELSGGMQKRVALARAIAMSPEVMLYDEPTTGIDPVMSDVINELIIKLKRKLNVTSIVVTHDMTSAYKVADRIAMLHEGKIVEIASPQEIRQTSNPLVKQFITGSSHGPICNL